MLQKVTHVSNLFHSKAPLELAKTLVDNSCFDKVFFGNSGTEANEGAYKFARLYANRVSQGTYVTTATKVPNHVATLQQVYVSLTCNFN